MPDGAIPKSMVWKTVSDPHGAPPWLESASGLLHTLAQLSILNDPSGARNAPVAVSPVATHPRLAVAPTQQHPTEYLDASFLPRDDIEGPVGTKPLSKLLPTKKKFVDFTPNPDRPPGSRRKRGASSGYAKEDHRRKGDLRHKKERYDASSAQRKAPTQYRKSEKGLNKKGVRAGYDQADEIMVRNAVRKHKMQRRHEIAEMIRIPASSRKYLKPQKIRTSTGFRAALREYFERGTPVPKRFEIPEHLPGFQCAELLRAKADQATVEEIIPTPIHDDKGVRKKLRKLASVFKNSPYRNWQHHYGFQPAKVGGRYVLTPGLANRRIAYVEALVAKQPTLISQEHLTKLRDLLIQAGDVELNPGPHRKGCQCRKCAAPKFIDLTKLNNQVEEECAAYLARDNNSEASCSRDAESKDARIAANQTARDEEKGRGFHRTKKPHKPQIKVKIDRRPPPAEPEPEPPEPDTPDPTAPRPLLDGEPVPPHVVHRAIEALCGDPASVKSARHIAAGQSLGMSSESTIKKIKADYAVCYLKFNGYLPVFTQHWWFSYYYTLDRLLSMDIPLMLNFLRYWKFSIPLLFVFGLTSYLSWSMFALELTSFFALSRWIWGGRIVRYLRSPSVYGKRMTGYVPHIYQEGRYEINPLATQELAHEMAHRILKTQANFPKDQMDMTVYDNTTLFIRCSYEDTQVFQDAVERGDLTFVPGCNPLPDSASGPYSAALKSTLTATEALKQHFRDWARKLEKPSSVQAAASRVRRTSASLKKPCRALRRSARTGRILTHLFKDSENESSGLPKQQTETDSHCSDNSWENGLEHIFGPLGECPSSSGLDPPDIQKNESENSSESTISSEEDIQLEDSPVKSSLSSSLSRMVSSNSHVGSILDWTLSRCSRVQSSSPSNERCTSSSTSSRMYQSPSALQRLLLCAALACDTIKQTTPPLKSTSPPKSCKHVNSSSTDTCAHGSQSATSTTFYQPLVDQIISQLVSASKQRLKPVECPEKPAHPSGTDLPISCSPCSSQASTENPTFPDMWRETTAFSQLLSNLEETNSKDSGSL